MQIGRLSHESEQYGKVRDKLLAAEIALKNQRETVAALRRDLPLDTEVEDYPFHEGPRDLAETGPVREVRLSGLFDDPDKPLVIYQFMYGGAQEKPCPMCALWTDGLNGVAHHIRQSVNFAVAARAPVETFRELARERGWTGLRLLSSDGSSFKQDFRFETGDGGQLPGFSVFVRRPDGGIRHFYSGSAILDGAKGEFRGIDMLNPVWNLMDLLPAGRGDWMPRASYG